MYMYKHVQVIVEITFYLLNYAWNGLKTRQMILPTVHTCTVFFTFFEMKDKISLCLFFSILFMDYLLRCLCLYITIWTA